MLMQNTPSTDPPLSDKQSPLIFLFLVAAGLAGNYFNYPVFLNIDFLFGSIFAMLALQLFGTVRGTVAAAIIASYTVILWNHPYAIITMTAEVAAAGWLFYRRGMGLVIADILFWLIIGMPLTYVFYRGIMHASPSNVSITIIKQAMNGIANTLIARLIFTTNVLRIRSSYISYREMIYNLLSLFVLAPALIFLMLNSRSDFAEIDHTIRTTLVQTIHSDARQLEFWIADQKNSTNYLAEQAVQQSPRQMQTLFEQTTRSNANFLRMGMQDQTSTTVAYFPLTDDQGKSNIGKSYADRPYCQLLKQCRKPMLSEMVLSKMVKPRPFVAVLAPILTQGKYHGYISAILNLDKAHEILARDNSSSIRYTLIDKNSNVIMTNCLDQTIMTPFVHANGELKKLDNQVSQWIPRLPPATPAAERWKKSYYVAEAAIGEPGEWKLILEQPVAPFQNRLFNNYTGKLVLLFCIMLLALKLAETLSNRMLATHEKLLRVSDGLPVKVASNANIDWPTSGIAEVMTLINNFRETSESLSAMFYETQQINESLEQRVEERSNELRDLMLELDIIMRSAPVGILKIIDRKIIWCNRTLSDMFHYSRDELKLQSTRKLYASEDDYEKLGQEAYPVISRGLIYETEQEMIDKDGSHGMVRCVGSAIEPGDLSRGTIWILEDITRRKHDELEKKTREQQYQETQRLESLGVLAGGIAHDFNNLLAVIIGNCALVRLHPEKFANNLEAIEKASERAATLCRQMLEYAGHSQFIRTQIDMRSLVEDMVRLMASTGHKNIVIRPDIPAVIPFINGDSGQIQQILMNLITNAIEAIGEAQGEIDVVLSRTAIDMAHPAQDHLGRIIADGAYVCLAVTDNGCGMDEESCRRIFEPFFSTKFMGRGLGLSATLGIISAHGGALQLASRPGKGTSFRVYLPALDTETEVEPSLHLPSASEQGSGVILLVEDEEQVRQMAREMLEQYGFTVLEAGNGREALERYRENPASIRVVLTDVGMPVMDGYELFSELKKIQPELPIIISSGFGDKSITARIPEEKVAGIISKPYSLAEFERVLKSALGQEREG